MLATLIMGAGRMEAAGRDDSAAIRAAIEQSLPRLQSSARIWIEKRQCVSCHHQAIGTLAVSLARERGFRVNETEALAQLRRMHPADPSDPLVGEGAINGQFGRGYMLVALAGAGVRPSPVTDVSAHYVAGKQDPGGRWPSTSHRPPLEDSSVTVTALDIRALQAYGPANRAAEWRERISRARAWLEATPGETGEERAFRLLGLWWAGASPPAIRRAAADLGEAQRSDGGWAQLATRESDAYATGQALVALNQAGDLPADSVSYRRGVSFLLSTRRSDGTWRVPTRRKSEGLPYFETGFPHGEDQFISYAASAWATMALTLTVAPGPAASWGAPGLVPHESPAQPQAPLVLPPLHAALLFGTTAEVRARLDAGDDPNAGAAGGVTPLMCAVHDPARVRLLLDRGAQANARTPGGHTALLLASGYDGARESVRLLLEKGADPQARASSGMTPILAATESGDPKTIALLRHAGAALDEPGPDGTAFLLAVYQQDAAMLRLLAAEGARLDATLDMESGLSAAGAAAIDGSLEIVRALVEVGAPVDQPDAEGMTPLFWAATVDPGHTEIVGALLSSGADPNARSYDGRTPLAEAEGFGNWEIADRLRLAGARCD